MNHPTVDALAADIVTLESVAMAAGNLARLATQMHTRAASLLRIHNERSGPDKALAGVKLDDNQVKLARQFAAQIGDGVRSIVPAGVVQRTEPAKAAAPVEPTKLTKEQFEGILEAAGLKPKSQETPQEGANQAADANADDDDPVALARKFGLPGLRSTSADDRPSATRTDKQDDDNADDVLAAARAYGIAGLRERA